MTRARHTSRLIATVAAVNAALAGCGANCELIDRRDRFVTGQ
jgi:hypothetical protein